MSDGAKGMPPAQLTSAAALSAEASRWIAPAGPQHNPQMVPQSYKPLAPCLISQKRAAMTVAHVGDI